MNIFRHKKVAAALCILLSGQSALAYSLTEYINDVKANSLGFQSTEEQSKAAQLKGREADTFFTPKFYGDFRKGVVKDDPGFQPIQYSSIDQENYVLGISQDFSFGLQTKLSYTASFAGLKDLRASGQDFGDIKSWTMTPRLELTLPLLGGGFGRTARANRDLVREQNAAEQFGAQAQNLGYLVEAEAAYWQLASTQEIVLVQKRAVENARNIFKYVSDKARKSLGEKADVIQAQALLDSVSYQLQLAQNNEKAARRNFNSYLNRSAETDVERLKTSINFQEVAQVTVPGQRPGNRYDVQAAEAQNRLANASANLTREKNRATFDLYGSVSLNDWDTDYHRAMHVASTDQHQSQFVGVRFNVPLNVMATSDAQSGAFKSQKAAELALQHKQYLQEQDWNNLSQRISEAKENFRLVNNIVDIQKQKVENERTRLRQGRTTTYQVLLFEQDYTSAEVSRVAAAAQILGLQAQVKMYQTSQGGAQ